MPVYLCEEAGNHKSGNNFFNNSQSEKGLWPNKRIYLNKKSSKNNFFGEKKECLPLFFFSASQGTMLKHVSVRECDRDKVSSKLYLVSSFSCF